MTMSTTCEPKSAMKPIRESVACAHCGLDCPPIRSMGEGPHFCCTGCSTVYALLHEHGMERFYAFQERGVAARGADALPLSYAGLDVEETRARLLDFTDGKTARIRWQLPTMHCAACVWVLERLQRFHPGVLQCRVNFPRREASVLFRIDELPLSALAALLHQLGYPPDLSMERNAGPQAAPRDTEGRRLAARLGVAGFAFGNLMLFSVSYYLGLNFDNDPRFAAWVGGASLLLGLPVATYCASPYWTAAWRGLRQGWLVLEVPIVIGVAALYLRSAYEIIGGSGEGYLDTLAGLLFFMLIGRWFQQRTYSALRFDRDYTAYFPMHATRIQDSGEQAVPVDALREGDRILLRHRELVPADAELTSGEALLDYSFVTGESDAVAKKPGEMLYAGGRQMGGAIEARVVKPVERSYLTSLWSEGALQRNKSAGGHRLSTAVSRWFTPTILLIACLAGVYHALAETGLMMQAFAAVLIVACPCALALSSPFALGSSMRLLGKHGFYVKDDATLERMASVDRLVFDKTGTLSHGSAQGASYTGRALDATEKAAIGSVCRSSLHPLSRQLAEALPPLPVSGTVRHFEEVPGCGLHGKVGELDIRVGSARWLMDSGVVVNDAANPSGAVHVAINGQSAGFFVFPVCWRLGIRSLFDRLRARYRLTVLSGDTPRQREELRVLTGLDQDMLFEMSPHEKMETVRTFQEQGESVAMIGDGLNDAGALAQSDVGISVTESAGAFSPACDAILDARSLARLPELWHTARTARQVIIICMALSLTYNVVGVSIAAAGLLSPLICAILMPFSSITVAGLAVGLVHMTGRRHLGNRPLNSAEGNPA